MIPGLSKALREIDAKHREEPDHGVKDYEDHVREHDGFVIIEDEDTDAGEGVIGGEW